MNKSKLSWIIFPVILIVFLSFCIWYFSPKTFLEEVSADEIAIISVFNGSTGKRMDIDKPDVIKNIADNIKSVELKKGKISSNYDGYAYSLTFKDKNGKIIEQFIINDNKTIRDDPFFYHCNDGTICFDYLKELENTQYGND